MKPVRPPVVPRTEQGSARGEHRRRLNDRWMMFVCCVPMVAIVAALVATGVIGLGYAVWALLCVAMMPLLHAGMSHEHGDRDEGGR